MSEVYTGVNGGFITVAVTIPTDGDDVNAASVDPAFQVHTDNWQHAKAAYPDMQAGGVYAWAAELTIANELIWLGQHDFFGLTFFHNIVTITGGTSLVVASGNELNLAAGSTNVQSGTWSKSGAGAWTILRTIVITTSAPNTFHAENYDVVIMNTVAAGFDVGLTDPNIGPLPVGIVCRFVIPNSIGGVPFNGAHAGSVDDHAGNHIAVFAAPFTPGGSFCDVMTVNVGGTVYWVSIGGNSQGD
ncbi:MAG TPA: hypothetical protein VNW46_05415 [Gemmatimonadaceae bacterium]|jgi:hypothetical protein|nr:hypothetical protein [Gemmatimonadaceae bacterium]